MKWITKDGLTLERMASPWLITRFVDQKAEILFVPEEKLDATLQETAAIPFDIEGVEFSSTPQNPSFDRILFSYRFTNPALKEMADLLRGADLEKMKEAFKKAGFEALIPELSQRHDGDLATYRHGLELLDALYSWCQKEKLGQALIHNIDVTRAL